MNVTTTMQKLLATKQFDPNHKMTQKEVQKLLSLALKSPMAFNIQNWRIVFIKDKNLRKKIRKASWNQPQITDASLLIILCADLKAWEEQSINYWRSDPLKIQDYHIPTINKSCNGLDQVQRDEAMRSCGIIAQTLMLAALSMSYDACPIGGFDSVTIENLINLPDDLAICMFVAVGKAVAGEHKLHDDLTVEDIMVENTF